MKKLYIFLIILIAINSANAQGCLPEGIEFSQQTDIDNFQTNYPGCTEIEGYVIINGDITNLNGLSVLTSIGANLVIGVDSYPYGGGNPYLTSLTGLDNLTSLGGYLHIGRNIALATLSGLEGLTTIGGEILIEENDVLINLNGLDNVTSIGEELYINENDVLTNLTGLDNVTSIGGGLHINENDVLTNLTSLDNLTSIGGYLSISNNDVLTNLTGLDNVTSIGGGLSISNNDVLTNLTGLDNVTSIGGALSISNNDALTSLSGMESLTSIGELLWITDNAVLTSLSELESLTSIGWIGIWIMNNNSLSTCEAEWLCDYMSNPNGSINIYGNAEGCSNPSEVADSCGITPFCLPYGNYYFHSQADINDFQSDYPDCTELEGNVIIEGNDITSLTGLSVVTSIGNILLINDNIVLTSLTGLDNVTSIGGPLSIYNTAIFSLTGLDNVTSIGGGLEIGSEYNGGNPALTNLTGLNNLTSIGGDLIICWNNTLTSLMGLDNVAAGSITNLTIKNNISLSMCDVQSICNYLASPNGSIYIWSNATGCNNQGEVEEACLTTVEEIKTGNGITIIPNPSKDKITISSSALTSITQLTIFNVSGEKVLEMQFLNNETQIDISALQQGVYFVSLQNGETVEIGKLIKE